MPSTALALAGQYAGQLVSRANRERLNRLARRLIDKVRRDAKRRSYRAFAGTSLAQRIGTEQIELPTVPRQPGNQLMQVDMPVRRLNYVSDHSSYQQYQKLKYKSGRKRTAASKRDSILQSIIAHYRIRISRLTDLSVGRGAFFLTHDVVNDTVDNMPLLICNLSSIRQGNTSASPLRRLQISTNPLFDGLMQWAIVNSQAVNNAGALVDNAEWQYEDNEGNLTAVGRKSWMDWVRIRLTLWGKQNAPCKYYIRMVKFTNDEYCPERYPVATGMTANANAFYQSLIKPLITDPSASQMAFPKGAMKVLKSWTVEFDPISTTEADQDPHCKALDIFHRFGKSMDYTSAGAFRATAAQLDTGGHYLENNDAGVTPAAYGVFPRQLEDSVYLMITTLSQDKAALGVPPTRAEHASLSWNIQVAHKSVQPDTFAV